MRRILTPAQAKEQDTWWMHACGIPSETLMRRAAAGVADAVSEIVLPGRPVTVVCGKGNNAGDGLCCACLLHKRGIPVSILMLYLPSSLSPEAAQFYDDAMRAGIPVVESLSADPGAVLVDAIFGVGLSRPVTGVAADVIQRMNESGCPIVAVDLPSGLDGLSGRPLGCCVRAATTVTFQQEKTGMLLAYGLEACGKITVCRIADQDAPLDGAALSQDFDDVSALLPARPRDSHKGKNGHALLCVGSAAYTGAAVLSVRACLRGGAGITRVLAPSPVCTCLRQAAPESILIDTQTDDWDDSAAESLPALLKDVHAIGCGSGMGRGDTVRLIRTILGSGVRTVLDADALNCLSAHTELLPLLHPGVVLTPHPGEMSRLLDSSADAVLRDPVHAAKCSASAWHCTVLLKGAGTCISDGERVVISTSGNAGLAKGGSGDVLTGLVTALLAQGLKPFDSARAGAFILGDSADRAYRLLGTRMLLASDVSAALTI